MVAALGVGLAFGFGGVAIADDDDEALKADHTTYTSESETSFACFCPPRNICRVHATISNVGNNEPRVDIRFQDGDFVTIFVPDGTSHSLTQLMGTRVGGSPVDDLVVFDPRTAQSVTPIVAWVSIERLSGRAKANDNFGCATQPY
jgi:hypothetical protein